MQWEWSAPPHPETCRTPEHLGGSGGRLLVQSVAQGSWSLTGFGNRPRSHFAQSAPWGTYGQTRHLRLTSSSMHFFRLLLRARLVRSPDGIEPVTALERPLDPIADRVAARWFTHRRRKIQGGTTAPIDSV